MKKVFVMLIIALVLAGCGEKYSPGDANGDGDITIADMAIMQKYITGGKIKKSELKRADANKDGIVNERDLEIVEFILLNGDFGKCGNSNY